jgi:hypothetical protein
MFERRHQELLPRGQFLARLARSVALAAAIVVTALGIGVVGYHEIEGLPWVDAILDAAMILSGMGPVSTLRTTPGKLFAASYALFSGIVFVAMAAVVVAPLLHRLMHRFHLDAQEEEGRHSHRSR